MNTFLVKAVYYLSGGFGILWFLVWTFVVTDEPTTHKFITQDECGYIMKNRQQTIGSIGGKAPPYFKILLNPVVWVIMICDFSNGIACYMVMIEGPNFIANILNKDITVVRDFFFDRMPRSSHTVFEIFRTVGLARCPMRLASFTHLFLECWRITWPRKDF